ncbi:NAD(P)/FAD-dependent oxidoreductase [Ilumatobacter coccineus]|uniref:Putative oxidoreductase n=1 Tax=Ilumatobacter coccineus (strain NBRC 103263 / KCTC 29153 / YM16-304) TaxID=1313172 RepID=A0A6C7E1E6_ILUCY|nr:FAD-binding oxidoreductase [Ilumatobacter coccineus]BAN01994.1 putative oxidoreductase [Ilumatobacter coccineus YM16-304]
MTEAVPRSLWLDRAPLPPRRPALDGDADVDVAIVGGGFSGLWTAYYLTELDPTLRIAVIEKHYCGFGASGRNGGWAVGELAGATSRYAEMSTRSDAHRLELAVFDAVDEIGRVARREGIECGYAKGGNIRLARTRPQAERQRAEVEHARRAGIGDEHLRLLDADEARRHCAATDVRSGIFFAPCAALDPARLVRGLADTVEQRGVTIHEDTAVTAIDGRRVVTERGTIRADVTVRALEAYTRDLAGERRDLLPVYSLMIATEPLPSEVFDEIGLADRQTFNDDRTMVIYGQRTDDDRLAFGGTGIPYRFGSVIDPATELHEPAHHRIRDVLVDLFPSLDDAVVTHRWGGVLGIPRNWLPSVHLDRASGTATLGGYVGEGVAAANLAGRTLAELIHGDQTDRTTLPWVGARHRRWEPEPLRWLGVRTSRRLLAAADRRETRRDRPARAAMWLAGALRGD